MMRSYETWLAIAAVTAAVYACDAEDSAGANVGGVGAAGAAAGSADASAGTAGAAAGSAGAGAGSAGAGAGSAGAGAGSAGAAAGTAGAGAGTAGAGAGTAGAGAGTAGAGAGTAGAGTAGTGGGDAADADCDMNGVWAVRVMSVLQALSLEQCGSLYYYLEMEQTGTEVEVVNALFCGIEGRGSSSSSFADATVLGLMQGSSQVGRKGTMQKVDGKCQLELERRWFVVAADPSMYLPDPLNSEMTLEQVQSALPMPATPAPGTATPPMPAGVLDVDGDGFPGAAFPVTGALSGRRHAAQRGVQAWLTNDRYEITPAADWPEDLEVRADYISEDLTYWVEGNQLLWAGALPVQNAPAARATLRFLGRDGSDSRAMEIVGSTDPNADPDGALMTCENIRAALPPIVPLPPPTQVCPCPGGAACM
jgi:hypothetical protein